MSFQIFFSSAFIRKFKFSDVLLLFGSVAFPITRRTSPGREPFRLKRWTLSDILSVVFFSPRGHICTDSLFDDYSAGLCFSRANADLRYIQSENALDITTSAV